MANTPKYQFEIDAALALARAGMTTTSKGKDVTLALIERLLIDKFTPQAEGVYNNAIALLTRDFGFRCRPVNKFVQELRAELDEPDDESFDYADLMTSRNN